jgi:hypothetical protein
MTYFINHPLIARHHNGDAGGEHYRHGDPQRRPQHPLRRPEVRGAAVPHLRHEVRHPAMVSRHKLESSRRLDVSGFVLEVCDIHSGVYPSLVVQVSLVICKR